MSVFTINIWVCPSVCQSPSVTHFPFFHGHLNMATYETDQEGVSTDPLWFALSVPPVLKSAEALFSISSVCRIFPASALELIQMRFVFPVKLRCSQFPLQMFIFTCMKSVKVTQRNIGGNVTVGLDCAVRSRYSNTRSDAFVFRHSKWI